MYEALSHATIPFESILSGLGMSRSAAHSPLFQAFIDYRQGAREKMIFGDCQLELLEFEAGRTAYDLSLDIIDEATGQPLLMLMAQASLYTKRETELLAQSLVTLIEAFAHEPELHFDKAPLYKSSDREKGLACGRGTLT